MKYTDLKTFKDACKAERKNYTLTMIRLFFVGLFTSKRTVAFEKLLIIVRAANRLANNGVEWIPNYDNWNEYKYEPWFDLSSGGFRFHDFGRWNSATLCGSRLCFISREVGDYIVPAFLPTYKDYLV